MRQKKRRSSTLVTAGAICEYLSTTLAVATITDYACNGLQVQGRPVVRKVGCAVDACMETFRMAVATGCDMLVVHHGIIWGGITSVTGRTHALVKYLLENDLTLYAVHLPLDLHPVYGNNAVLAKTVGLRSIRPFGVYKGISIGYAGSFTAPVSRDALVDTLCRELDGPCTVLPFGKARIRSAGIVSGGAADILREAIDAGLDCFITGESSHENYHAALEAEINVIYAGHYHTETAGVKALGTLIEKTFEIETVFLDCPTYI